MGHQNHPNSPPTYEEARGSNRPSQPYMNAPNYGTSHNQPPVGYVYIQTGPCSRGGDHAFTTEFTLGGVLCALFFFPIGILCCLCLTEKRCLKCGGRFD